MTLVKGLRIRQQNTFCASYSMPAQPCLAILIGNLWALLVLQAATVIRCSILLCSTRRCHECSPGWFSVLPAWFVVAGVALVFLAPSITISFSSANWKGWISHNFCFGWVDRPANLCTSRRSNLKRSRINFEVSYVCRIL